MKTILLFQQMLVLFAMMMTGFLAYRLSVFSSYGFGTGNSRRESGNLAHVITVSV